MECFRWLHLTDLHWGSNDHRDYWGAIEPKWFEDIDRLKEKCKGEWDAVFFTGDLVNRGEKSEFQELSVRLTRLFEHLGKTGSKPVLLVIPGNHDLKRPSPSSAGGKTITQLWHSDESIRNSVWQKQEKTDYWKTLQAAFKNFNKWWESAETLFPIPTGMKKGLLPGEFAVTLEKDQYKIGVVGLNTAFLQLSDEVRKGNLDAHPSQLIELCGSDHQDWIDRHDACFLLTHHPLDWLCPRGGEHFKGVIAPPGRFALHLCGHQHESAMSQLTSGGAPEATRTLCGCSLFGLQKYFDWENNTQVDRRHGYSAGYIDFPGTQPTLRIWPRLGIKKGDSVWSVDRDQTFYLKDDGGTKEIPLPAKRKKQTPSFSRLKEKGKGEDTGDEERPKSVNIKKLVGDNIAQLLNKKKME